MAQLMRTLVTGYHDFMNSKSDPRMNDWLLMGSPFPTLAICLSYVYFVKVLGPRIMDGRKPMNLWAVLIVYNFVQVVFNAWLFYELLAAGWLFDYSYRCQPVDYSNSPQALRMARVCWWYYFAKITELLDTIFFVLRKKNDQISILHVIHHGIMPMDLWIGVKFTPGGHGTFFLVINSFLHIIMYTYYLFAAMGPRFQKYLWWKKYLTVLQMVQFILVIIHSFQLLFIDCNYPKALVSWIGLHGVMFYFLFDEFYKQSYKKKQESTRAINAETSQREWDLPEEQNGLLQTNRAALYEQHDAPPIRHTTEPRQRAFVGGATSN